MMIYLHVSEWYHQHNPNFNGWNRQKSQLRFIVAGVHWLLYWWSFMIHDMSPAKEFALGQLTHDSASANWLSWVISLPLLSTPRRDVHGRVVSRASCLEPKKNCWQFVERPWAKCARLISVNVRRKSRNVNRKDGSKGKVFSLLWVSWT